MTDFAPVLASLRLASHQAEELQASLRRRQDDLLHLERGVRNMTGLSTTGRIVIDQAEDVRRALRSDADDHLDGIREALIQTDRTLDGAGASDGTAFQLTHVTLHLVDLAAVEVRRAVANLEAVRSALSPIAQAFPSTPDLALAAQRSLDTSAGRLESARRSVFRLSEDLPAIARAVKDVATTPAGARDVDLDHTAATDRLLDSTLAEMRLKGLLALGVEPRPGPRR